MAGARQEGALLACSLALVVTVTVSAESTTKEKQRKGKESDTGDGGGGVGKNEKYQISRLDITHEMTFHLNDETATTNKVKKGMKIFTQTLKHSHDCTVRASEPNK